MKPHVRTPDATVEYDPTPRGAFIRIMVPWSVARDPVARAEVNLRVVRALNDAALDHEEQQADQEAVRRLRLVGVGR